MWPGFRTFTGGPASPSTLAPPVLATVEPGKGRNWWTPETESEKRKREHSRRKGLHT